MIRNLNFLQKKELLSVILLIIISLCVRVPFLPDNIDFNNDAGIYSDNIEKVFFGGEYDVQPPGYISYIYAGRALNFFINNTVYTQHIINIILVIFISVFFYKLLKKIKFKEIESFIFSIIFSFNNILMLGSLTGGNRLFLTLSSILLIYYSYEILYEKKTGSIYKFAFYFAFLTGFRQDLSFNFMPLFIFLLFKIKKVKPVIISLIIFTFVCLSWFIPLIIEYGGFINYLNVIKNQKAVYDTSIIFSFGKINSIINFFRIFIYLANAFFLIFIFFIYTNIKRAYKIPKELFIILLFSLIPALIFQLLVHNGNFVHLAAFMVPIFIFLIYSFRFDNKIKFYVSIIVIFLLVFQFFGIKMFKNENIYKKASNILWLQYSYDGVKSGETRRLNELNKE